MKKRIRIQKIQDPKSAPREEDSILFRDYNRVPIYDSCEHPDHGYSYMWKKGKSFEVVRFNRKLRKYEIFDPATKKYGEIQGED
jgi:hypothetical protein